MIQLWHFSEYYGEHSILGADWYFSSMKLIQVYCTPDVFCCNSGTYGRNIGQTKMM